MTFEHRGLVFNLLDTPVHDDFSEDTYRTLTAVDSAVMVIDAAKGIEPQTLKLFEVCRLRSVPIITFINKVDREGQTPFELLDEVADRLALDVCPMNWPAGMGGQFEGIYDLVDPALMVPGGDASRMYEGERIAVEGLGDPRLAAKLSADAFALLKEETELASACYAPFDAAAYRNGDLTPVFFGSALKEFGVVDLLAGLANHAPGPQPQTDEPAPVQPGDEAVTGFVFKVQANMNPAHRDRIAFMRLCSGKFRSEEHTSELQSLMRTSYAVFCLKKKINQQSPTTHMLIYDSNNKPNTTKSSPTSSSNLTIELIQVHV